MSTLVYDGCTFRTAFLPAPLSRKTQLRLARVFGGALEGIPIKDGVMHLGGVNISKMVAGVLGELSDADMEFMVQAFASVTEVQLPLDALTLAAVPNADPSKVPFLGFGPQEQERAFGQGKGARCIAWLVFAVRSEYADFFSDLASGKLAAATDLGGKTASPAS